MTLIAAFWCAGNQAVLCADSQETEGDYKVSVRKIQPRRIGPLYQVAYAGSGNADIVDALGEHLEESLLACRASGVLSLRNALRSIFTAFYEKPEVKAYRAGYASGDVVSASPTGVICIRVEPLGDVFLFKFSSSLVTVVKDVALCGLDTPPYRHLAERLHKPALLPLQARLLGLYLLTKASTEHRSVDAPFNVVFVMKQAMFTDDDNNAIYVSAVIEVQRAMDQLLLSCADTHAVSEDELNARLKIFGKMIRLLRKSHAKALADEFKRSLKEHKSARPKALRRSIPQGSTRGQ